MGIDLKKERAKQAQLKTKGKSDYWKPVDDENLVRVLPFQHKVTKEDVAESLYTKDEVGKTMTEWYVPVVRHFGLLASNRKVPVRSTPEIMELYYKLKKSKNPDEVKRADDIKPQKKYAMNIIDLNDPEKGVQIWLAPRAMREFIGDHLVDPDFGEAILGAKGRDVKIKYNSKATEAAGYYKLLLQDQKKCRAISSSITDKSIDLYDPKVYGEFAQVKEFSELDAGSGAPAERDVFDPSKPEEEAPPVKTDGKGKTKSTFFDD